MNNELPKIETLTKYQEYCLYNALEYALTNSRAFDESYKVLIKTKNIVETSDFGELTLKYRYLRLGFVSYCLEQYDNAENWLLKAFEINYNLSKDLVILISSLEKTNKVEVIKEVLKKIDTSKMKAIYGKKYLYTTN